MPTALCGRGERSLRRPRSRALACAALDATLTSQPDKPHASRARATRQFTRQQRSGTAALTRACKSSLCAMALRTLAARAARGAAARRRGLALPAAREQPYGAVDAEFMDALKAICGTRGRRVRSLLSQPRRRRARGAGAARAPVALRENGRDRSTSSRARRDAVSFLQRRHAGAGAVAHSERRESVFDYFCGVGMPTPLDGRSDARPRLHSAAGRRRRTCSRGTAKTSRTTRPCRRTSSRSRSRRRTCPRSRGSATTAACRSCRSASAPVRLRVAFKMRCSVFLNIPSKFWRRSQVGTSLEGHIQHPYRRPGCESNRAAAPPRPWIVRGDESRRRRGRRRGFSAGDERHAAGTAA